MKIGTFNTNAPVLINKFEGVLNKLLNGDTKCIDSSLRTNLNTASGLASEVQSTLNKVSSEQLKALRTNAKAGNEFGTAVDNAASLAHITGVLINMINELAPEEEKEESLDDILGTKDDENCGTDNANTDNSETEEVEAEEEEEDDVDSVMDKNAKNGGPADIDSGSQSASKESADGEEAAVAEGDDISNALQNMMGISKSAVKKASNSNTTNSNSLVALDFLK